MAAKTFTVSTISASPGTLPIQYILEARVELIKILGERGHLGGDTNGLKVSVVS